MNILKKVGDLLSPNDPELVEKTLARLNEQDTWNDVFSTKLIELLDKVDQIKREARERLRKADERVQKAESVTQAESLLLEKAARFGDASQRLELAEAAEHRASAFAEDAKNKWERATSELDKARQMAVDARSMAEDAKGRLGSAQEALLRATWLLRLTVRYATVAVSLSWIAMSWTGWFMVRTRPFFWAVVGLSTLIIAAAVFVVRWSRSDT